MLSHLKTWFEKSENTMATKTDKKEGIKGFRLLASLFSKDP